MTSRTKSVWWRELPWLVGVIAGCVGLWWRGYAFVPLPFIASYDWMEYVPSAWMVANDLDLGGYATWRNPLYPGILGHLGEIIGYNEAGWLLASVSMFATVFGAGLGARAMAGPWAGLTAAAIIPFINPWAEASRWSTLYPMLTACTALSLAFGAAWVRWPRVHWAALAGVSAGLAWGIDFRGLASVVTVVMLGAMTLPAVSRGKAIALIAATLIAISIGPVTNDALSISDQKQTQTQVQTQRELELRLARESDIPDLSRACANEPVTGAYPSPSTFLRPCAHAFLRDNLDRFKDQAPFGVGLILWMLPLVLLPLGRGRRDSAVAALVFGSVWGTLAVMGVWARLNVHHFVQFSAAIAMTVPVAGAKLLSLFGAWGRRSIPFAAVGAVAWVATQGPWTGKPVSDIARGTEHQILGQMVHFVQTTLGPDDQLLDCSGFGVEAALLPRRFHAGPPNFSRAMGTTLCDDWVANPPQIQGQVWLLNRESPQNTPMPKRWIRIQEWRDGPRRTWIWRLVDRAKSQP
jgi:hypothetical protein